jgi:hypothetical protein
MFIKFKILTVAAIGVGCIGISEGNASPKSGNCSSSDWNPTWTIAQCKTAAIKCVKNVKLELKNCKEKDKNKCKITPNVCAPFMKLSQSPDCQNWTGYYSCMGQIPIVYPNVAAEQACNQQGLNNCTQAFDLMTRKRGAQSRVKH